MTRKKKTIASIAFLGVVFALGSVSLAFAINPTSTNDKTPILFVHGWTESESLWDEMIERFIADGWSEDILYAYTFSSNWAFGNGQNAENAEEIKVWVEEILAETGASKVDLISHSMGGLSTRYYIKFLNGIDYVEDYVSLGSPHHGTTLAYLIGGDMKPGSDLLDMLNDGDETPGGFLPDSGEHIPGDIDYTSIYAVDDELVWGDSAILDGAINLECEDIEGIINHIALTTNEEIYTWIKSGIM